MRVEPLEGRTLLAVGQLDPTFGNGGRVITDLGGSEHVVDMLTRPDGKIVVSARSYNSAADVWTDYLLRYNANGTPDTTFGTNGRRVVADAPEDLQLLPDGDLVGIRFLEAGSQIVRYNADGTPDTSYGGDGRFTTVLPNARGFFVQPDGKVLVAGAINEEFAVARHNADGSLDTSFGGGDGVTSVDVRVFDGGTEYESSDFALGVGVQPSGKIVAGGGTFVHEGVGGNPDSRRPGYGEFVFARFNTDGSLDTTYGAGGLARDLLYGDSAVFHDFVILHDGSAALAGSAIPYPDNDIRLVDPQGQMGERSYSGTHRVQDLAARSIDNAVGAATAEDHTSFNLGAWQMNGGADFQQIYPVTGITSQGSAASYTPDGTKLVIAGETTGGDNWDIYLVRIDAGGAQTPYTTPSTSGQVVQFENFDKGGEGVAYHDVDASNNGGAYRPNEGVDIKATTDAGGGYFVGWAEGGEWLEYTFDVAQAGQYTIDTRVASPKTGGSFEYVILGHNTLGGTQQVPNTGSFTTFRTVTSPQFELDPGRHTVRFRVNQGNVVGGVANFNWFRLNRVGDVDTQQPTTPPNARATGVTSTSASLDWDAATDDVGLSGYRVVTFDGQGVIDSQFVPADQTAFTVTGLQPDKSYTFEIRAVDFAGNVSQQAAVVNARTSAVSTGQQPFFGSPFNPGVNIQAEDYDRGGEGLSFHDLDAANRGTASTYRTGADVGPDIYNRSFGRSVGYVQAGEWLEYTINVPTAGNYDLSFRVANPAAGARVSFQLDGNALGNPASVPNTGSWNTYSTVTTGPVALPAGTHVLRLSFDTAASNGSVGDFDWVRFSGPTGGTVDTQPPTAPEITSWVARAEEVELNWSASTDNVGVAGYEIRRGATLIGTVGPDVRKFIDTHPSAPYAYSYSVTAYDSVGNRSQPGDTFVEYASQNPAQTPFKGSPFNPGQTIQAEDFDNGGEGIAYHDNDSINRGPSTYRPGTGVDLYTGPHGVNIGYVQPGEWTEYTVNVPEGGDYNFSVRAAHVQTGARFSLSMVKDNLQEWTASAGVPNTGSWNNYATITLPTASLPAGVYTLRLSFDTAAANGSVGNIDSLRFDSAGTTLPAPVEIPEINNADAHSIDIRFNETQVPPDSIWRVERQKEGTTDWVLARILNPGQGSFVDEGLERGTSYNYRYRA